MIKELSEIKKSLLNFGLNENHAKIYLSLLKRPNCSVGVIAKEVGLSKQNLYNYLDQLQKINLIDFIYQGKIKKYFVKSLKKLKQQIADETQNRLQLLDILEIEVNKYQIEKKARINFYQGQKEIQNVFISILKKQAAKSQIFSIETNFYGFYFKDLMGDKFELYERIRINKGFKVNPLIVADEDFKIEKETTSGSNTRSYNETRIIKIPEFGFSASYIWSDRVWLLIKVDGEYQILEIQNFEIVKTFKFYFTLLWQTAQVVYKSRD